LRTEFRELKQTHLDVNRRYSESLITLRGLTLHATESAEKAASAAEHVAVSLPDSIGDHHDHAGKD